MFISNVMDRGATPALVKTLAYNEARLKMIAENVANSETPGYKTKRLDAGAFQRAIRKALDERGSDPNRPFRVDTGGEVETDQYGYLQVTPSLKPVENILFHDGTNMSIERQMADLAETGVTHEVVTALLRGRVEGLRKAIRGQL